MDKTKIIKISKDLELDAEDFLESAIGDIGKRGTGKSGLGKVIMEELYDKGLPFIMLDPVGVHWGIRSSFDGRGPSGRQVLIVGGSHGDIPLDRHAGAEVASAIVQANVSAVIDFSDQPKVVYREFVEAFAHKLYAVNDTSRMVLVEEAPELVPQRLRPDMTGVFEAVERLVSRGRNRGIGVVLISQRAATISKDVLTQIDALFVFGLTSPQDRKALHEWVEAKADPALLKDFEAGIAGLQKQEAWFWAPSMFKEGGIFQKIKVRDFTTFHPDKTHLRRRGLMAQKPVMTDVPKIVEKLSGQLAQLAKEKVDLKDIPKLQSRIRQLEKDNQLMKAQMPSKFHQEPAVNIKQLLAKASKEAKAPLESVIKGLETDLRKERATTRHLQGSMKRIAAVISAPIPKDVLDHPAPPTRLYPLTTPQPAVHHVSPKRVPPAVPFDESEEKDVIEIVDPDKDGVQRIQVTKSYQRILCSLAQLHDIGIERPKKVQVALWSEYSPNSGGYNNYLGKLRYAGLIEYDNGSTMYLTDFGRRFLKGLDAQPPVPADVYELREQVFRMVGESKSRILKILIEANREILSREQLAERAEFSPNSGGYNNYLGKLRSMGLVEYVKGGVIAAEVLFQ